MDISDKLSISAYELGQMVWCFDTIDRICKPAIILEQASELHSYWHKMEDSMERLHRTHLHIKPHLNTTKCKGKQMMEKNQTEETFQYTSGMHKNELLPKTPSQSHSKDDTLDVKETSTPNIPLRRSTKSMKGISPQ